MPSRYKYRRRRYRSRRGYRRYRRSFRGFRKAVKRVLYNTAELKQCVSNLNYSVGQSIVYSKFITSLPQSVGDDGRIANNVITRYLSIRISMAFAQPTTADDLIYKMRMYIVFPRKMSDTEAVSSITTGAFPIDGLVDQDKWIIWKDKTFLFTSITGWPNATELINLKWYKRFPMKLEFANAAATIPIKQPGYIVWASGFKPTDTMTVRGYIKVSYKDI